MGEIRITGEKSYSKEATRRKPPQQLAHNLLQLCSPLVEATVQLVRRQLMEMRNRAEGGDAAIVFSYLTYFSASGCDR